jgi:hypothetical protein
MSAAYFVLGQIAPTGTSETTLYTVTSGKQAVCSSLTFCNITTSVVKVSVNVRPAGAAVAAKHALARNVSVAPGSTNVISVGLTLASTDVVSVNIDTANGLAVHLYGTEI